MQNIELPTIKKTSLSVVTGFVGGVFFCAFYELFALFNFIKRSTLMPDWPFLTASWQGGFVAHAIWWGMISAISILWAIIYQYLVKKAETMWAGIWINVFLFVVIFILLGWALDTGPSLIDIKRRAAIAIACLFVLHGAFVGYSISYDEPYHEGRP
ncbi:YqhR family membrane protein [Jeotgalibacillus soli]|uniref:Uncharacterized protein n=1 Tax=Jeotgalibacillus soli TaxID=889306 RepID=A0A0C2VIQ0_9BACL|nr:YqhR family membrane protein [Jeotgalibacillus soli]KIL44371.1 hypothetical protein KP78_33350 [Jeotgalibacillus soli]